MTTSLQALAVQSTAHTRSGYATATYFTMFDLGIALGSYILGMVAVQAGYASVYLTAAGLLVVVFIIYLLRLAKIKAKKCSSYIGQRGSCIPMTNAYKSLSTIAFRSQRDFFR